MKYFFIQLSFWFKVRNKKIMYAYWSLIIATVVVAVVISLQINHTTDIIGIGGNPTGATGEIRQTIIAHQRSIREHFLPLDFYFVLNNLQENYPFFNIARRQGLDIEELVATNIQKLDDSTQYFGLNNFLLNFINDNFISYFENLGSLHLVSEPRMGNIATANFTIDELDHQSEIEQAQAVPIPWISQPYFFGIRDWRLYDERFYTTQRNDNIITDVLTENTAYISFNSFLPHGMEEITRRPFWYFEIQQEMERILEFYDSIYNKQNLIIDIRGLQSGFGSYFMELLVAPNIEDNINATFYGFHTNGSFAHEVSQNLRDWYGFGELLPVEAFLPYLTYTVAEDFEILTHGFEIALDISPSLQSKAFEGNIWLLTDTANFSGYNQIYLEIARLAGFNIVYTPSQIDRFETSLNILPYTRLSLRYNPIYFTDAYGRNFQEYGMLPHHILEANEDPIAYILQIIEN